MSGRTTPRVGKSGGEGIHGRSIRSPHHRRGRDGCRNLASTEGETTTEQVHVRAVGDLLVPPGGIGARQQREHHRPGATGFRFLTGLVHPAAERAAMGPVREDASVPEEEKAIVFGRGVGPGLHRRGRADCRATNAAAPSAASGVHQHDQPVMTSTVVRTSSQPLWLAIPRQV